MATIGTFTKSGEGFVGAVKTLTLNVKAQLKPAEKTKDNSPDFRIFTGQTEFGAAWNKKSKDGRDYVSVKLDDPSFPTPIFASLVKAEEGENHNLIWSRRDTD